MLTFSVLIWQFYENYSLQREERRYDELVDGIVNDIVDKIYRYEMVLQGGAGVFAASEEVTREEWQAYCEYQQTVTLYPGVQGVGFTKVLQPSELENHLEKIRAEGFPDYKVWPEGSREIYTTIIYLEPFDERNQRAFGYDMFTEPVRRSAMEHARDSGNASISGMVTLVQETGEEIQPGFLMYLPVYKKNTPLGSLEQRRAAIDGYIYAPFRVHDLMSSIFPDPIHLIDFEIYDGNNTSSQTLMFDSHSSPDDMVKERKPIFSSQKTLDLYGHQWTLAFHSMPAFETYAYGSYTPKGILTLAAGLLLSFMIFFYLRTLEKTSAHIHNINLALQESEKKYRFLAENIADVIWTVDLNGNITYISPAIEKMIGFTPEEVISMPMEQYIVQEDFDDLIARLTKALAKPQSERDPNIAAPVRHIAKNNRIIHVEISASWLLDENHEVIGVQGASRDITERKKAEEEIRKLNKELEQRVKERTIKLKAVNKELESFAYSVSHDLRAPLRALDGFSAQLKTKYGDQLDDQAKHYLDRIHKAVSFMGELIDDLLRLSKVTRSEFKQKQVDISQMAHEIIVRLRESNPQRQVEVEIPSGLTARGDPHLLKIAMENLLNNAWKFSENNPQAKIELGLTNEKSEPIFFIKDNGAGFDMDYSDKLFGAFQRLHGKKEFSGTGIGLATVQRIINRHGGRIWAESIEGEGATFYFTLPS